MDDQDPPGWDSIQQENLHKLFPELLPPPDPDFNQGLDHFVYQEMTNYFKYFHDEGAQEYFKDYGDEDDVVV